MKLPPKQLRFCQEYTKDLNGTQAAIRAGYSKETAQEQSSRLLSKVMIQNRIKMFQRRIAKKIGVTAEMVVKELVKIGFQNIQDFVDDSNAISDISKVSKKKTAAVESIKITQRSYGTNGDSVRETKTELKLHSKVAALEMLGKHLGIFEKDNKQREPVLKQKLIVERRTITSAKLPAEPA